MIGIGLTHRVLLAVVCCFALILVPLSVSAQTPGGIIKKGAEGVQKGVETGVDKTKEGVQKTWEGTQKVGKETKKAITGESEETKSMREKSAVPSTTKPSQTTPSQATTRERATTGRATTGTTETERGETGSKRLPKTAGELPLLALVGGLALAASGTLKLLRRVS